VNIISSQIKTSSKEFKQNDQTMRGLVAELQAKTDRLADGLQEALQINKQLALQLYIAKRLTNHPEAEKIRPMIEHSQFGSTEEVDDFLEKFRTAEPDEDHVETVRARIRQRVQGGRGPTAIEENARVRRTARSEADYNGVGVSLSQLKQLSGLPRG